MSFGEKIWSIFAEDNGHGSSSRVFGFIALCFVLGWVTKVVIYTHAIPDLNGPATFLMATSTPYFANKLHNGITSVMIQGNQNQGN